MLGEGGGQETSRKVMLNEEGRKAYKERLKRNEKGKMKRNGQIMIE